MSVSAQCSAQGSTATAVQLQVGLRATLTACDLLYLALLLQCLGGDKYFVGIPDEKISRRWCIAVLLLIIAVPLRPEMINQ